MLRKISPHLLRAVPITAILLTRAGMAWGQEAGLNSGEPPPGEWFGELTRQIQTPLAWFGLLAQGLFFTRFVWQWLVSEKRKRSVVPIGFWYFSLAGGFCMFIYGCLRPDLVIMLGQLLACAIYARNLMLIHGRAARRQRAHVLANGLESAGNESEGSSENS